MKKDEFYEYALSAFRPAESLLKMIPADKLDWKPGPGFMTMGQLICHLAAASAPNCACWSTTAGPSRGNGGSQKQARCLPATSRKRWPSSRRTRQRCATFSPRFTEEEFANKIVSVPWGWKAKMEKMSLDFRDHFVHHKMQLFTYLKLLDSL